MRFLFLAVPLAAMIAPVLAAPSEFDGEWKGTYRCSEGAGPTAALKPFAVDVTFRVTSGEGRRQVDNAELIETSALRITPTGGATIELSGLRKARPDTGTWLVRAAGTVAGGRLGLEAPMYRQDGRTLVRPACRFELVNQELAARAAAGRPLPPLVARPTSPVPAPAPAPVPTTTAPVASPAQQGTAAPPPGQGATPTPAISRRVEAPRLFWAGTQDPAQLDELRAAVQAADAAAAPRGTPATRGAAPPTAGQAADATLALLNSGGGLGLRAYLDRQYPGLRRDLSGKATLGDGTRPVDVLLLDASTRVPGRGLVDSAALSLGLATEPDNMPENDQAYIGLVMAQLTSLLDGRNIALAALTDGRAPVRLVRGDWGDGQSGSVERIGRDVPVVLVFNQQVAPAEVAAVTAFRQTADAPAMARQRARLEQATRSLAQRLDGGRFELLGEMTIDDLAAARKQRLAARETEANRLRQEMEERIRRIREGAAAGENAAGALRLYRKGRQPAKPAESALCTTTTGDAVAVVGLSRTPALLSFAGLKEGARFTLVAKTPGDLYAAITADNCTIVIDRVANLWTYMQAIGRDGQFAYNVGPVLTEQEAREPYAVSRGFRNWADFEFAGAIGDAGPEDLRRLNEAGIGDIAAFRDAAKRMTESGYDSAPTPSAERVLRFLGDEAEGRKTGQTALAFRRQEEEREAEEARAEAKAAEQRRAARAKAFPYEAVLSCGMGDRHLNILACFAGGSSRVDTELRLTIGNTTRLYKVHMLREAGSERADGLHIELPEHFAIMAQNAHETLVLGLKIIARETGEVLHQNQVARFGVLSVKN